MIAFKQLATTVDAALYLSRTAAGTGDSTWAPGQHRLDWPEKRDRKKDERGADGSLPGPEMGIGLVVGAILFCCYVEKTTDAAEINKGGFNFLMPWLRRALVRLSGFGSRVHIVRCRADAMVSIG